MKKFEDFVNESSLQSLTKFLNQFPDNATNWSEATDEVRDIARTACEYYNDLEDKDIEPCNFRSFKTPKDWNTKGKEYIFDVYQQMSPHTKKEFHDYLKKSWEI